MRVTLAWQVIATLCAAALAAVLAGGHGAISTALGGGIGIAGALAFAVLAARSRADSAEGIVFAALKAETLKVLLFVGLLLLVLATYKNVVVVGLIASFAVSALISAMAFFVREA